MSQMAIAGRVLVYGRINSTVWAEHDLHPGVLIRDAGTGYRVKGFALFLQFPFGSW